MKRTIKIILSLTLLIFLSCRHIPSEPAKPDKYEGRDKMKLVGWGHYIEDNLHKCDIGFRSDSLDLVYQITYSMPYEATTLPFGTWHIANNEEYSNLMLSDTVSAWQCIRVEEGYNLRWVYYQVISGKLTITDTYVDLDIDSVYNQSYKNLKFRIFEVMPHIRYSR
ncbi:MAG: hypothetical protein LBN95_09645 [Prevotellaceae bacterium]|jgi:hypothetical protein|nr:hypothetical protein [Prevotellaceae bacterium]